jgi:hypothetical protein
MNKLLLVVASLVPFFASNPAHADRDCGRKGAPLVTEIHAHGAIDVGNSGFEIYESGAWHVYHHDPKAMDTVDAIGCLTADELASVKEALAKAPWKVTHDDVTCDAIAIGSTEWAAGKHTFSQVLCGRDSIDSTTQKAFAIVEKLEQKYTPKPATRAK